MGLFTFLTFVQVEGATLNYEKVKKPSNSYFYSRRPRGMFFSAKDKGEMASMVYNWESDEVDAVVVTDGSR